MILNNNIFCAFWVPRYCLGLKGTMLDINLVPGTFDFCLGAFWPKTTTLLLEPWQSCTDIYKVLKCG